MIGNVAAVGLSKARNGRFSGLELDDELSKRDADAWCGVQIVSLPIGGITIGSFDDPSPFRPKHHFGAESILENWIDTGTLPRFRTDEYDVLVQKWKDAGMEPPA
mgnify:CR=1 FL=1